MLLGCISQLTLPYQVAADSKLNISAGHEDWNWHNSYCN